MALQPPGEFEFEQDRRDQCRREAGLPDQLVDRHGGGTEQPCEGVALGVAGLHGLGMTPGRIASSTSSAVWIRVAPSRISKLQPWARGSSGEPGTAITS